MRGGVSLLSSLVAMAAIVATAAPARAADPLALQPGAAGEVAHVLSAEEFEARHSGLPAVSAVNFKFEAAYAKYRTDPGGPFGNLLAGSAEGIELAASATVPLEERFGLQVDGMWADVDGVAASGGWGVGGHLFWRDPAIGLLGGYAHYMELEDIDVVRYGIEGEGYLEGVTFSGFAGADQVNAALGSGTYLAAEGRVSWYVTPDFVLTAGIGHAFDRTQGLAEAELMLNADSSMATSLFAEVSASHDSTSVRGGLRFYLGGSAKSLMARHREDDPAQRLTGRFGAVEEHIARNWSGFGNGGGGGGGGGGLIIVPIPKT